MSRRPVLIVSAVLAFTAVSVSVAQAATSEPYGPGAPGIGDPYFPLDGNGGYDVGHYGLEWAPAHYAGPESGCERRC